MRSVSATMSSRSGGVGPAEAGDVLLGHHRVVQRVVLVVVLDDRARQAGAFGDAEAGRQAAGGDVANHDLERDDLDLADQLLAHVEAADEVGRDADVVQAHHQVFADAVVQHALAGDHALLGAVAGGGIVLEVLHERAGFGSLEQDLGFALIELSAAGHCGILCGDRIARRRAGFSARRRDGI